MDHPSSNPYQAPPGEIRSSPPVDAHGPLSLIVNDGSGRNDARETEEILTRVFADAGRAFEFHRIDGSRPVAEVAGSAVDAAVEQRGVVVAVGGDGTINAAAQAALGRACAFGVIPQGTFNYFGRAHGIPQEAEPAARALLAGSARRTQVGLVNDRAFLVNASLGLYPQLLEDREAWKSQLGRSRAVAALAALATVLRERRQLDLTLQGRGQSHSIRTPTLFVGNNRLQLERVGCAEAAALDEGLLAAIMLKPVGTLALLGLGVRGALGSLGDAEHVVSFAFDRITVSPRRSRSLKVATDGEIATMAAPLVFRVSPEPLWLVVPPQGQEARIE